MTSGAEFQPHAASVTDTGTESHIRDGSEDEIGRVLMLLLVNYALCTLVDGATNKAEPAARLETIATDYGVDLAKVKSGIKAQIKKAASDTKVDAAASAVQADRARSTRKPKPTHAARSPTRLPANCRSRATRARSPLVSVYGSSPKFTAASTC